MTKHTVVLGMTGVLLLAFTFLAPAVFAAEQASSQSSDMFVSGQKSQAGTSSAKTETPAVLKDEDMAGETNQASSDVSDVKNLSAVEKKMKGTVTGVTPQGMALEYAVDKKEGGKEVWLNFAKKVKFLKIQDASELEIGDIVVVVFDEMPDKHRLVKEIGLIQKKPKDLASESETVSQESAPGQEN